MEGLSLSDFSSRRRSSKSSTEGRSSEDNGQGGRRRQSSEQRDSTRPSSLSGRPASIAEDQEQPPTSLAGRWDSRESVGNTSTSSGRTSFALERGSLDHRPSAGGHWDGGKADGPGWKRDSDSSLHRSESKHNSLDRFWSAAATPREASHEAALDAEAKLARFMKARQIPQLLRPFMEPLAVLPADVPLPFSLLSQLWRTADSQAKAAAQALEQLACMRLATLQDGSSWGLVPADVCKQLQACGMRMDELHERLLDSYYQAGSSPQDVTDDGYFMLHLGEHMIGARRLQELRSLLCSSSWLQAKMTAYGAASVVADFRRYLLVLEDDNIKLLLQAFQLSTSTCAAHPDAALLPVQMTGRLLGTGRSHLLETQGTEASQQLKMAALKPLTASLEQAGGLHRLTLRGHSAAVTDLLLLPDGIHALSASEDASVRFWDLETGICQQTMEGHTDKVLAMATGMEGGLLVTGSADMTAKGRFCATASGDGTCRLWSLANGQCAHILRGSTASGAYSGRVFAVALNSDSSLAITASDDFLVRIWDVSNGRCRCAMEGHTGWVVALEVSPDDAKVVSASQDGTARIWDLQKRTCCGELKGHTGRVNAAWWSAHDRNMIITASDDMTARVWDCSSQKCRHVLEGHGGWVGNGASSLVSSTVVTAGGDNLAVAWNAESGACANVLEGHSGPVNCIALSRKARFAVSGSEDATVRVWDLETGSLRIAASHQARVHSILKTTDGLSSVTLGKDGQACIWEAATGKLQRSLMNAQGLNWGCITNDDCLLSCSGNRGLKSWNMQLQTSRELLPEAPGSRVKWCALSRSGGVALIVLYDSTMAVWDLTTQQLRHQLQRKGDRDSSRVHSGGVNAASISPSGSHAVSVSKDQTARIWDLSTGACVHVLGGHASSVVWAEFDPTSKQILTLDGSTTVQLWDVHSGLNRGKLNHGAPVAHASFAPDGASLLTSMQTIHELACWSLPSLQQTAVLKGHTATITHSCFWSDSRIALSCSEDCSLRLWQTSGDCIGLFASDDPLVCCAFVGRPASPVLMAGSEGGAVHFVQMPVDCLPRS
ncbi:hypothetical protein WJX84_002866 [Apatococcus fuscideae]|uniref:APAF-1 helical domain-containing protein n=1 Tax=Apatococcus fuscideae TaxID=2026836 RepID=A0AAW1SP10_9CHLO